MSYISVEEWELISFFEVESVKSDTGIPWVYCDNLFVVQKGEVELSFAIYPSYRDVRVILKFSSKQFYELNVMNLKDVCYGRDEIGEVLSLQLTDEEDILLRINPEISVIQKAQFPL